MARLLPLVSKFRCKSGKSLTILVIQSSHQFSLKHQWPTQLKHLSEMNSLSLKINDCEQNVDSSLAFEKCFWFMEQFVKKALKEIACAHLSAHPPSTPPDSWGVSSGCTQAIKESEWLPVDKWHHHTFSGLWTDFRNIISLLGALAIHKLLVNSDTNEMQIEHNCKDIPKQLLSSFQSGDWPCGSLLNTKCIKLHKPSLTFHNVVCCM